MTVCSVLCKFVVRVTMGIGTSMSYILCSLSEMKNKIVINDEIIPEKETLQKNPTHCIFFQASYKNQCNFFFTL